MMRVRKLLHLPLLLERNLNLILIHIRVRVALGRALVDGGSVSNLWKLV